MRELGLFEDQAAEYQKEVKEGKIINRDIYPTLALPGDNGAPNIQYTTMGDFIGRCRRIQIETLCVAENGNYKRNRKET